MKVKFYPLTTLVLKEKQKVKEHQFKKGMSIDVQKIKSWCRKIVIE